MVNFVYEQPVKIYFGAGKLAELGSVLDSLGTTKAVIVCGRHFASEAVKLQNGDSRIAAIFSEVEANPQLSGAEETVRLARECGADTIIGIGGGSALDTAKFAAATASGEEELIQYYRGEAPFPGNPLKIVAVPTTAGTGSEVTMVSVISHGDEKRTIRNESFMPDVAIVDPVLTVGVPARTTMMTGLDALDHALEGYWSKEHQPITDLLAIEAVDLILNNLEKAYRDGNDVEARTNMSYAALLAGLAFALPKTAASHACSYPLSEDYHLPHGEACAFTLDSLVFINGDDRLEALCSKVGCNGLEELAERIRELKSMAGLRSRLGELGDVDLDKLARDCAAHPLMKNNPVALGEAELKEMFEKLR